MANDNTPVDNSLPETGGGGRLGGGTPSNGGGTPPSGTRLNYIVEGTSGDDLIDINYTGDPEGDRVDAGDARDGSDDDVIRGFGGHDTIYAGRGNDDVRGDDGNDTIFGESGDDLLNGGAGNDTIEGGSGNDEILGGRGNDTLDGTTGNDYISGGDGNDTISGGQDDDCLEGGAGDDTMFGNTGNDKIFGNDGNDTIRGGQGNDRINGNAGDDNIRGDRGEDFVVGGTGNDTLFGNQDNDEVYGEEGDDIIDGGSGADRLGGGDDADTFVASGRGDMIGDYVDGGAGGYDCDTLDLRGSNVAGGTLEINRVEADSNGNGFNGYVEYFDADGASVGTLDFHEIEKFVPCFTPGTMIATPSGERLVEDLRVGDKIITRDNGIQEIRWTGNKRLDHKALLASPHLRPIMIKAGAFGHGLPERDMLVSPNHRMLVANDKTSLYFDEREVLAAAKHMTDAPGISSVEVLGTTYIHFMCDRHEVVLSNGAWSESFQPGDYTLGAIGAEQRAEILELFPELANEGGVKNYAAARTTLKKHEARLLMAN